MSKFKTKAFSLSATGTVIDLVAGRVIKVYAVKLVVNAPLQVAWRSGTSDLLEGSQSLAANGGYAQSVQPDAVLFQTGASKSLDLVIGGVGTAAGVVSYWDMDAK